MAIDSTKATLAVKRRLACEMVKYWQQAQDNIMNLPLSNGWGEKHRLFIKWKYIEAKGVWAMPPATAFLRESSCRPSAYGGNLMSWKSKKQDVVARSNAEADYRAMTLVTCELIWLKQLLQELELETVSPMKLICDNQAALHIASNPAAAYYYHGLILDEGNTEKSHGMAVAALQAADEYFKESKRACEVFNAAHPLSR
ncbi:hypothetical protein Goshw_025596 [Gossypium schwendimanii]|uniref:Uncharacterized protein n=1 Tax=Gossypium schwendimanii TaxID=34291 RepID=A0A7J9LBY4_GOSSC|nr:hypothetical protein [Gossypium schwendimanii]